MIIETKDFGNVKVDKDSIIYFPEGIYGFEQLKEYVILEENENPIKILQAVNEKYPNFAILDPKVIVQDYNPELPKDILSKLKLTSQDNVCFFVIAIIPKDIKQMTVNLKSPILINFEEKIAMQIILDDQQYPVRYFVFEQ